jgi:hypothetical protein
MLVLEKPLKFLGYEQVETLSSAVGLTEIPDDVAEVWVQAEDVDVRFRADGTDPTASVGQIIPTGIGVWWNLDAQELHKCKFIETAASAKLSVTYFRPKDA